MAKRKSLKEQVKERFEQAQEQVGWPDSYQKLQAHNKFPRRDKWPKIDKETEDFLNGRGEFS